MSKIKAKKEKGLPEKQLSSASEAKVVAADKFFRQWLRKRGGRESEGGREGVC